MPRYPCRLRRITVALVVLLLPLALQADEFPSSINRQKPQLAPTRQGLAFCVFGDCQPAGDASRFRITSSIARAMAVEQPQFVMGLGDYIDGAKGLAATQQQWQRFFAAIAPLMQPTPIPLALTIGNHDDGSPLFERYFGRRYFSFNVGNVHVIILDSQQPGQYGQITGTQWQWLNADLTAAAQARFIFVTLHQPLFPVSVHRGSALDRYPNYRDRLHMLFARQKVSAVFSGHEHLYNHQQRDGVHYFISGGGGAPLYAEAPSGGFYHYLLVECTDESFSVQVKRLNL
ncbi:metallophosphoesterase [bacterium]|nr:metallophosphoesterase [bacterium]